MSDKWNAIIRLTRWREHVPFTIALVVIGAMLAVTANNGQLDWRLLWVIIANILAMSFAFMINDVEDAPDDALDPKKRAHNVISSGILTRTEGLLSTWFTFIVAFLFYVLAGGWTVLWGGITLILSYLYSAHPFRLKARPITDVTSHALMLSGLLVMTGVFTYTSNPGHAWYVVIAAILFSAYGQFYNQVEDYEVDKKAGLRNTVVLLGKIPTMILMYTSLMGAVICMGFAVSGGIFPAWLGTVGVVSLLVMILFPWEYDMRGNEAQGSGIVQRPSLIIANMIALLWMAHHIGFLAI